MQISLRSPGLAVAVCATSLLAAVPAQAKPVTAELRVEAGRPLLPGYAYVTDSARFQTDRSPGCDGSGASRTIEGPSALGLLESAAGIVPALRPVSISDKFDFGLLLCGIGGAAAAADGSSYWLYKVNHEAPQVGADQFPLKGREQVLWYFVDPARGINSGDAPNFSAAELELLAPARARPGRRFTVRALEYDASGRREPAAGVRVLGASGGRTDSSGRARILSGAGGWVRLRGVRGSDVPAEPVNVCLSRVLRRCQAVRGERIFGTDGPDRLRGTRGADVVDGLGGGDVIDVRGGERDRVRCGPGRDVARLGRGDRAARDCERVRR